MNIFDILYSTFIGPLELLYDVIYTLFYYVTSNPGLSIVALSIFINVLLLPLYNRADKIQEEEKDIENKLKPGVDHIKKSFKGDEQYMVLQTYYRQNNYKPYYSLKGLLPLLLEIPFFIAAYNYLSNLSILEGASFWIIDNLKQPDGLLNGINLLPILMTIINIISSSIYTKGDSLKSKIQLYGMALIFLVLLYNSPSGLVMYWTLNNLFSLIKNILVKLDNCNLIVSILCSTISILGIIFIVFIHPLATLVQTVGVCGGLLLLQLPIIFYLINKKKVIKEDEEIIVDNKIFYLSCLFLCALTGLLIPTTLIGSSPSEFIDTNTLKNPLWYVLNCFCLSFGTFVIWFNVYYALLDKKIKKIICSIIVSVCIISLVDYMFFGTKLGTISNVLIYDNQPTFEIKEICINSLCLLATILLSGFVWLLKNNYSKLIISISIISIFIISSLNMININKEVSEAKEEIMTSTSGIKIPLSQNGKNVIVIMLDRELTYYIPYYLEENPELIDFFDGFTYYPNTTSYGGNTGTGSSALYGGYEYIPSEMNRKSSQLMVDKHNEALKLLPDIFYNNGYEVTVCDPPYAGYKEIPDLSIYDEYEDMNTYITRGAFNINGIDPSINFLSKLNRNLFCYSIMKISPLVFQNIIYNYGYYNDIENMIYEMTNVTGYSKAYGIDEQVYKSFGVLSNLENITEISNSNKNTFLIMDNELSHALSILKEPEYVPDMIVDNTEYDKEHEYRYSIYGDKIKIDTRQEMGHYHVSFSPLLQLGKYFDYLRENGVYDNTRIIIVSDHGFELGYEDNIILEDGTKYELTSYLATLLVKDFNSTGFNICDDYMTNADVPTLATNEIISNPTNPFTGKEINSDYKNENESIILDARFNLDEKYQYKSGVWFSVDRKDIYNKDNWKVVDDPNK